MKTDDADVDQLGADVVLGGHIDLDGTGRGLLAEASPPRLKREVGESPLRYRRRVRGEPSASGLPAGDRSHGLKGTSDG